jgi:LysM repeat protein
VLKRKRMTLMPAIALAALGLMVALPTLSSTRLYAAGTAHYATVTVRPGDTLWRIAAAHTGTDGDVQDTIDRIIEANRLGNDSIRPGERLRIPD